MNHGTLKDSKGREVKRGDVLTNDGHRVRVLDVYIGILWVRWLDLPEAFRDHQWLHANVKLWTKE